jgi:AmmeMemoRadiSam system protein B
MMHVRPAAVAGMFYPGSAAELSQTVDRFLKEAETTEPAPKAMVAPHAGYIYSGPVAASAYARLRNAAEPITRVILLGPSHRVPFHGLAVPSADYFETPLGRVHLDRQAIDEVVKKGLVQEMDVAHAQEHSLEVHLPFLQKTVGEFDLVPIVVGEARPEETAAVIEALWGGPETLIVVSSDLSHYLDYASAKEIDAVTSHAIETLHGEQIGYEQACGRMPIQGLLLEAKRHGLKGKTVDLRNSGDTAGPRDQVVGYGAYVFSQV